ncbi:APC family permease [Humibacillus xanthopallidus]|uniref:Amino acid:proton symporter (ABT family) n=1 Tax=Humibacillus xanthopallidus TaxID=412689 RepID=A0A543HTL2_9MICO|nr:APC family permease [Humibacillus xanthopallidus]TQM61701.1 amino acid:proton symporter (ABT family) [Humibacillus xanthopallidus]
MSEARTQSPSATGPEKKKAGALTVRQAAFIGVGSMVGAGIFALLGAAGEVAGAAVWISFLLAGTVAALQGYSFARLGARYPAGGGFVEYVVRGWGDGHLTGVIAWMLIAVNAIITAMVAVSFGSYASAAVSDGAGWTTAFAVLILLVMAGLNVLGSQAVARAQTVVVVVVVGILTVFSVATIANLNVDLLAFSGYPSFRQVVSSVALTFFAFLGFGVITFTSKDLAEPRRQLPRAVYLALAIATVVYVAVAIGVFGTLTVEQVIASGGTALAVAAEPVLGSAGYWLMSITALFATAGATNSGLYPATGLADQMAASRQFPPVMGHRVGGRASMGIVLTTTAAILMAIFLDLNAIASIGSAVALIVFTLVTFGHMRIRRETGARLSVLVLANLATIVVLVAFAATTLVNEPATTITLVALLALSVVLDLVWKSRRPAMTDAGQRTR